MTTPTSARPDVAPTPYVEDVEALRAAVRGSVLQPGEPGFAESTLLWNGMIEKSPALAMRATGTADVVRAVDFAHERSLPLSVRGGGHNIAGTAVAEGGLTIDMSMLRGVVVDPEARTTTVQPGCLLGDVDRETQLHGLAVPLGFFSDVGVAGLTLGGGLGYLSRRFGWTVDNLLEVEIVTADGRVRRANRDENEDLFWAIRGAGANLGVVTRFTFGLHTMGPIVHGGLIAWPFERAADILGAYRELTAKAPRELAVWLNCLRAPEAPFVPPRFHGERIIAMVVCYSGDLENAVDALVPIRALEDPIVDLLGDLPYAEMQSLLDGTEPKGHHYYWKTEFLSELDDGLLETWLELAAENPIPECQLGILHLGGSLNGRAADDGAVGNRDAQYACGVLGAWEPSTPGQEQFPGWVRDAWRRMAPYGTGGNYINFQTEDEGDERVRATYGSNYARLVEIKNRFDPDNLFCSNRNVAPGGALR